MPDITHAATPAPASALSPFEQAMALRTAVTMPSGAVFDLANPDPGVLEIEDIAHNLARIPRFLGSTRGDLPYSVAQHSVLVCNLTMGNDRCSPMDCFWALMHDAFESLMGDPVTPLKRAVPEIQAKEDQLQACVAQAFGLPLPMPEIVTVYDRMAFKYEAGLLMPGAPISWAARPPGLHPTDPTPEEVMDTKSAQSWFLDEFHTVRRAAKSGRWC